MDEHADMHAELKNNENGKRPAVGKQWLGVDLEVQQRRYPPPPKGEGVRACTKTAVPKRQARTAVAFRRGTALSISSYSSALHSKSDASMAQ